MRPMRWMKETTKGRVRVQPRLDAELVKRLEAVSAARVFSETAVMQRLDDLNREIELTRRDVAVLMEAFALWTNVWFAHNPNVTEEEQRAAHASAEKRYQQFVIQVREQFAAGKRFSDELQVDEVAAAVDFVEIDGGAADDPSAAGTWVP